MARKFEEYSPPKGANWNAMTGVGGVWIRDGEAAIVKCPQCFQAINLASYVILSSGEVKPEFTCPSCKWTDEIILTPWDERHGKWWRPKWFAWLTGKATEDEVNEEERLLKSLEEKKK
jgi:hypothetical protein